MFLKNDSLVDVTEIIYIDEVAWNAADDTLILVVTIYISLYTWFRFMIASAVFQITTSQIIKHQIKFR